MAIVDCDIEEERIAELERICSLNRMCGQVVIIELERDIERSGSIFFS